MSKFAFSKTNSIILSNSALLPTEISHNLAVNFSKVCGVILLRILKTSKESFSMGFVSTYNMIIMKFKTVATDLLKEVDMPSTKKKVYHIMNLSF